MTDKQIFNSEEGEVKMEKYLPAASGFNNVIIEADEDHMMVQEIPIIGWKLLEDGSVKAITIFGEGDELAYSAIVAPGGHVYATDGGIFESLAQLHGFIKQQLRAKRVSLNKDD
jgi:hypothetical protein